MSAVALFVLLLIAAFGLVAACVLLFGGHVRERERSRSHTDAETPQYQRARTPHPWQGFVDGAGFWVGGDVGNDGPASDSNPEDER
ncbi:hypothetical protein ACFOYW_17350 [Gryllotalpicola reticulitermitis]|uniref:Secreted protein n=1 Tax=Gryllotalpicola reticulitermitis TaxID=1184153 RepID=A0ABV8Q9V5_9MICO